MRSDPSASTAVGAWVRRHVLKVAAAAGVLAVATSASAVTADRIGSSVVPTSVEQPASGTSSGPSVANDLPPATSSAGLPSPLSSLRTVALPDTGTYWDKFMAEDAWNLGEGVSSRAGNVGGRQGDLDPSIHFHPDEPGIHRIGIDAGITNDDRAVVVSKRPDGKIYVAGQVGAPGATTRIGITRLTAAAGLRDTTFGANGVQVLELDVGQLTLVKGVGLTDGDYERLYFLGHDRSNPNNHRFALVCLRGIVGQDLPFGACPGFQTGDVYGIRYYDLGAAPGCSTSHDVPYDLDMDRRGNPGSDYRIYMVGSAQRHINGCADVDMALLKVRLDGSMDTSFNANGVMLRGVPPIVSTPIWKARATAVAVKFDGKVVVGGSTGEGENRRAVLAQFHADGIPDSGFCAPSVTTCDSPPSHRMGLRIWATDTMPTEITALAPTYGFGLYTARTLSTSATTSLSRIARVDEIGGCSSVCNQESVFPASATHTSTAALLFHHSVTGGQGHVVAIANNAADGTPDAAKILVYRFTENEDQNALVRDMAFSSGPLPQRNDITFPAAFGVERNANATAAVVDHLARYLIAGWADFSTTDSDFAFARLQQDVIFQNSLNE